MRTDRIIYKIASRQKIDRIDLADDKKVNIPDNYWIVKEKRKHREETQKKLNKKNKKMAM